MNIEWLFKKGIRTRQIWNLKYQPFRNMRFCSILNVSTPPYNSFLYSCTCKLFSFFFYLFSLWERERETERLRLSVVKEGEREREQGQGQETKREFVCMRECVFISIYEYTFVYVSINAFKCLHLNAVMYRFLLFSSSSSSSSLL